MINGLLAHGADINHQDSLGRTALMAVAAFKEPQSKDIFRALLFKHPEN